MNTVAASAPPSSPATSTSAQAMPSGYGRFPCSLTIKALLSGTMKTIPSSPPLIHTSAIVRYPGGVPAPSAAHMNTAGRVKIAPAARDSPAEPMV